MPEEDFNITWAVGKHVRGPTKIPRPIRWHTERRKARRSAQICREGCNPLCIQETNLLSRQATPDFQGWELAGREDRFHQQKRSDAPHSSSGHGCGGVLTLIKENSEIAHENIGYGIKDKHSEAIMTRISIGNPTFRVLNVYIAVIRWGPRQPSG